VTLKRRLNVTIRPWGLGQRLFRVHSERYRATEFNATAAGDARFSPLIDSSGVVIPTLYAGSTFDCSLMETVFHDVPYVSGPKLHSKAKHILGKAASAIKVTRHLQLIDLTSIALRKLGVSPEELTRTDVSHYSATRAWATVLHEEQQEAEGLIWTSRQDDTALALVLFGDRVRPKTLQPEGDSFPLLLADGSPTSEVQSLAARLDVLII